MVKGTVDSVEIAVRYCPITAMAPLMDEDEVEI